MYIVPLPCVFLSKQQNMRLGNRYVMTKQQCVNFWNRIVQPKYIFLRLLGNFVVFFTGIFPQDRGFLSITWNQEFFKNRLWETYVGIIFGWGIPGLPVYPESLNAVVNSETCILWLRWSTRGKIPKIIDTVISCAVIKHDTCDVDLAFCFENNSEFSKYRL